MTSERWARTSLCITAPDGEVQRVAELLDRTNESTRSDQWAIDLQESTDQPIQDQLNALLDFLATHRPILEEIAMWAEIYVQLSWSPHVPQDGLALDCRLLELLGSLGAHILLDTYVG